MMAFVYGRQKLPNIRQKAVTGKTVKEMLLKRFWKRAENTILRLKYIFHRGIGSLNFTAQTNTIIFLSNYLPNMKQ